MSSSAFTRFRSIRPLGEGGTGRVFEVEDVANGGRFALKMLRSDRHGGDRVTRFKDEFRGLQRVAHPNVARVYELLSDGGGHAVLMELVEGVDFLQYVHPDASPLVPVPTASDGEEDAAPRSRRLASLSVERLRSAVRQLVGGILALHGAGKVHCDIKPENVLVTDEGRVVIVDFGLMAQSGPRVLGLPGGTPAFMAPEQFHGEFSEAVDWYAVGVLVYVALSGRHPFEVHGHAHATRTTPVDPRLLVQGLPDDLVDLALRLLHPDPVQRLGGDAVARRVGLPRHGSGARAIAALIGRQPELDSILATIAGARATTARIVHLHGESGIGKSALLAAAARRAEEQGAVVYRGACYAGASVPYKGIDGLIDAVADDLAGELDALSPADRLALATMFPVFARTRAEPAGDAAPEPTRLRARAVAAVQSLIGRAGANAAVFLCVDDFQWSDRASIDILAELVRVPPRGGIVLLLSFRSTTESDGTGERVAYLKAQLPPDRDIPLAPLDARAVAQLVARDVSDITADELNAIVRESRGNPFFIGEIVRARANARSTDDLTVEGILARRIGALATESRAREYLELVALAGRPLEEDIIARALESSRPEALQARHTLTAASFLRAAATEGRVEPYHDRVREHVLRALEPNASRRMHAQLAKAYEKTDGVDPEILAVHHRAAGDLGKALTYSERAGDLAAQSLAFDHAAGLYAAALEMSRGPRHLVILLKYAHALSDAARPSAAADAFVAALAERPGDIDLQLSAGDEFLRAGQIDRGLELLRGVAETIGEPIPKTTFGALAALLWNGLRQHRLRHLIGNDAEVDVAEQRRLALCLTITKQLGMVDYVRAEVFQRRYYTSALKAGSRLDIIRGLALESTFCSHVPTYIAGGIPRADQLHARAVELSRPSDPVDARGLLQFALGMIEFAKSRWRASRAAHEAAVATFRDPTAAGRRWDIVYCRSFILLMHWMEGNIDAIREEIHDCLWEASGNLTFEAIISLRVGALLALCDDDLPRARRIADDVMRSWPPEPWRLQHEFAAIARAEADMYEGNAAAAWRRLRISFARSDKAGFYSANFFLLLALILRARAAVALGMRHEALRDIRRLKRRTETWAGAVARALEASILADNGDRAAAIALLEAAIATLDGSEVRLYAAAARAKLADVREDSTSSHAALRELEALGVRAPLALARSLVPSFGSANSERTVARGALVSASRVEGADRPS